MLVLASASPRRAEILRQAGIPFVVRPAAVDESALPGETPEEYVTRVAEWKAQAVEIKPGELVLGERLFYDVATSVLGPIPCGAFLDCH